MDTIEGRLLLTFNGLKARARTQIAPVSELTTTQDQLHKNVHLKERIMRSETSTFRCMFLHIYVVESQSSRVLYFRRVLHVCIKTERAFAL